MLGVYAMTWMLTLALKLKYEDCVAIVLEALNKNICLAMFVFKTLKENNPYNSDIFPSSIIIITVIVLLIHLLWEKIG